jgi:23S rRNA (pseudouridine1915-N3)-methyltransferase
LKIQLLAVGRPGPLLRDAIAEYEKRAARYWSFEAIEVREEKAQRGGVEEEVRSAESERLLQRVATGTEVVALTRTGERWDSARLSKHLQELAVNSQPGIAFLIGGALGLSRAALERAKRQLSLSEFTLPHELARLMLAEQLYRAGTIARREPYHKARA